MFLLFPTERHILIPSAAALHSLTQIEKQTTNPKEQTKKRQQKNPQTNKTQNKQSVLERRLDLVLI